MIGSRLQRLRIEKGFNKQEDLAKALMVSPSTVGMWETDKREPNDEMKQKIAELLNTTIDYLIGNSDIPHPIEQSKIDYAFSSGYNALNENNKNLINATIEGLLLKQKEEKKNKK